MWENEYSKKFDELRFNRVRQSYYKYGPAKDIFGQKLVNALDAADICVERYKITGNAEYLCDAANYIMFEFMCTQRSDAFFKATDSSEYAGKSGMGINELGKSDNKAFYRMLEK